MWLERDKEESQTMVWTCRTRHGGMLRIVEEMEVPERRSRTLGITMQQDYEVLVMEGKLTLDRAR